MADIEGTWEFHRSCPAQVMNIDGVAPDGELLGASYIGDSSRLISGHYDAATNAISFNDASRLGETLNVSFYSGYVIPDGKGGACAMAGTFQEAHLAFVFERASEAGHEVLAQAVRPPIAYPTLYAAWYAIRQTQSGPVVEGKDVR